MSEFAQRTPSHIAIREELITKSSCITKNTEQNKYSNKVNIKKHRGRRIYAHFSCA